MTSWYVRNATITPNASFPAVPITLHPDDDELSRGRIMTDEWGEEIMARGTWELLKEQRAGKGNERAVHECWDANAARPQKTWTSERIYLDLVFFLISCFAISTAAQAQSLPLPWIVWMNKYSLKLQLSCTAKKEIFFFRLSFHEKLSIPVALSGLTHWRAKEIFACLDKHLQLPEGKGSASRFSFVVIVLCSEAPSMMPASSEHQRMGVCISNSPAQRRLCWHSHKYWGCDKKCQPGRWECVMRSYFGNWDHVGEHNNL